MGRPQDWEEEEGERRRRRRREEEEESEADGCCHSSVQKEARRREAVETRTGKKPLPKEEKKKEEEEEEGARTPRGPPPSWPLPRLLPEGTGGKTRRPAALERDGARSRTSAGLDDGVGKEREQRSQRAGRGSSRRDLDSSSAPAAYRETQAEASPPPPRRRPRRLVPSRAIPVLLLPLRFVDFFPPARHSTRQPVEAKAERKRGRQGRCADQIALAFVEA